MDNIPDQGDEEANRILRKIIEDEERHEEKPQPRRTRVHRTSPLPPWGQHCGTHDGPPCWPLITDAAETLSDRARWPTHVCPSTVKVSLDRWTRANPALTKTFDARALYQSAIPLPIGKRSLADWANETHVVRNHVFGDQPPQHYADDMPQMPFDGDEYAALILTAQLPDARVTMFGLQEASEKGFLVADMQFRIDGSRTDHPKVISLTKNAREWWSLFQGAMATDIRRGRPRGTTIIRDLAEIERAWTALLNAKGEPPTQMALAYELCVHKDTLKRRLERAGTSWSAFKVRMSAR